VASCNSLTPKQHKVFIPFFFFFFLFYKKDWENEMDKKQKEAYILTGIAFAIWLIFISLGHYIEGLR
jgi:hypothetical protein